MKPIEPRALYNLLRLNWLNDPSFTVEPWQVEDYRLLSLPTLFERLKGLGVHLDKTSFVAHAEECDSPEELTDLLLADDPTTPAIEDQIYLLVFELWRRLMTEKPTLSIFCDELDRQIYLYDQEQLQDLTNLQDALTNLLAILEKNVDSGLDPKEAFQLISERCANDIEAFLYDFIAEQIDQDNDSYAHELLDGFGPYLRDPKWFDLLFIRLSANSNMKLANKKLSQVIDEYLEDQNLEFNLELLALMIEFGDLPLFRHVANSTLALLKVEEDFQDLLMICIDYYHRLDQEQSEHLLQAILKSRSSRPLNASFSVEDPDIKALLNILDQ